MIVASELYKFARLNLTNPNPVEGLPAYLYYVSKYANIMFTLELARRLEGTGTYPIISIIQLYYMFLSFSIGRCEYVLGNLLSFVHSLI